MTALQIERGIQAGNHLRSLTGFPNDLVNITLDYLIPKMSRARFIELYTQRVTDFSGITFVENLDFRGIFGNNTDYLKGIKFIGATLRGAVFDGLDISYVPFTGANLENASFEYVTIEDDSNNFTGASGLDTTSWTDASNIPNNIAQKSTTQSNSKITDTFF